MKDIFLQSGWPMIRIILTNWSRELAPVKRGFPSAS